MQKQDMLKQKIHFLLFFVSIEKFSKSDSSSCTKILNELLSVYNLFRNHADTV